MDTEEMSPDDRARQVAEVLCDVMNIAAVLHDESTLAASDPAELRAALLRAVDQMTRLGSIDGLEGITWPPDAEARLERLRAAVTAWNPAGPLPPSVLEAARQGLVILSPSDNQH
jgi:hypothetical protein